MLAGCMLVTILDSCYVISFSTIGHARFERAHRHQASCAVLVSLAFLTLLSYLQTLVMLVEVVEWVRIHESLFYLILSVTISFSFLFSSLPRSIAVMKRPR